MDRHGVEGLHGAEPVEIDRHVLLRGLGDQHRDRLRPAAPPAPGGLGGALAFRALLRPMGLHPVADSHQRGEAEQDDDDAAHQDPAPPAGSVQPPPSAL